MKPVHDTKTPLLYVVTFSIGTATGYLVALITGHSPSVLPVISAGIGLVVAFSVPLWQALVLNAPKLSIEISAISRTVSDSAVVALDDHSDLKILSPAPYVRYYDEDYEIRRGRKALKGHSLTDLDDLVFRAKMTLRELPTQIEERKKEVDRVKALAPASLTKYETDRLNEPLHPEVEFDPNDKEKTLRELLDAYINRLEEPEKRYAELQANLPVAERRVELIRTELINKRSFFTVSASLINSGRSNTAIKVPGLLRVSVGEGNYIDLKLNLKDFENKSEISANGTRIVVFESAEVSTLPEEDRKLINTYWGQSVSSTLMVEDIHSRNYASNRIAFAEGLYQKIIYDRLARAASEMSIG